MTQWVVRLAVAAAILLQPIAALAEGSCPPGMVPIHSPGVMGCAPMGPAPNSGTSASHPVHPVPYERWGAIALGSKGAGVASNASDRMAAESHALSHCMSRGSGDCEIIISYRNSCAVGAFPSQGGGLLAYKAGVDLAEIEPLAIANCSRGNDGRACSIVYRDCSGVSQARR